MITMARLAAGQRATRALALAIRDVEEAS